MKPLLLFLFSLFLFLAGYGQSTRDTAIIYFPFDSASLTEKSKTSIDRFIEAFLQKNNAKALTIKGFCDTIGSYAYNDRLADRRVATVQRYLVQHGILPDSITFAKGYGKRAPVNANRTEAERQLNRRVEILYSFDNPVVGVPPAVQLVKDRAHTPLFSKALLDTLREGQIIRLRNINFYGGRHTFLPQAKPILEELQTVMQTHPGLVIEIQGHICCMFSGYDADDFDSGDSHLSRNRAKAVYDFLRQGGIAKERMSYRGFAGSQPLIYPERSEEDRTVNRRVEIKIVRK